MQIRKETGMFPWLTSFQDITVQDSDEIDSELFQTTQTIISLPSEHAQNSTVCDDA